MKNISKNALVLTIAGLMLGTAHASNGLSFQTKNGAEASVYGFVRGDAVYTLQGNEGVWNSLASATPNRNDISLNTTVATTRLGLNFKAPVVEGHKVGGKIEGDFHGNGTNGSSFRIRHAYVTYDNFLVGQTWSTFNDLNVLADVQDFMLIAGQGADRVRMVRYEKQAAPTTTYAVALEQVSDSERTPALVGRVQQQYGSNAYVSARGFVSQAKVAGFKDKDVAWGVGVGASFQVNDKVKLLADYNHIKGNSNYIAGSNAGAIRDQVNNKLELNEFDSVVLGTAVQVTPKVKVNAAVSYMRADDDSAYARTQQANPANKELKQGFINVQYSPVKPVTVGLEYVLGERKTFNDSNNNAVKAKDERIGVMAQYTF